MNYEYKDEILEHIGPEPNCNYQSERDKHYEMLKELDEVYRKAQAFDEIKALDNRYKKAVEEGRVDYDMAPTVYTCEVQSILKKLESEDE